jgi:hypothetical protein
LRFHVRKIGKPCGTWWGRCRVTRPDRHGPLAFVRSRIRLDSLTYGDVYGDARLDSLTYGTSGWTA